jgi:two-component system, cell cycle response regulator CtrA
MQSFTAAGDVFASAGIETARVDDNRIHDFAEQGKTGHVVRTGKLVVNLGARIVEVDGRPLRLTGKEYGILELLSLRNGTTVTKEMFLNHLYGGLDEPEHKIIDVFVCKLRKKLDQATGGEHYIETVWGRGYRLRDPVAMHTTQEEIATRIRGRG